MEVRGCQLFHPHVEILRNKISALKHKSLVITRSQSDHTVTVVITRLWYAISAFYLTIVWHRMIGYSTEYDNVPL
jgi:hypothetical protein